MIAPTHSCAAVAALLVAGTACVCGLHPQGPLDGRSLVPLLRDPHAPWPHAALTTHDFDEFAVRTERWRYIRYIDGSEELYDCDADPQDWHKLAGDDAHRPVIASLAAAIPDDPAPLLPTSLRLQPHRVPPFRSRAGYEQWLAGGKDTAALVEKHWQRR